MNCGSPSTVCLAPGTKRDLPIIKIPKSEAMTEKLKTIPWRDVRAEAMSNPAVREEYDAMAEEFAAIDASIKERAKVTGNHPQAEDV